MICCGRKKKIAHQKEENDKKKVNKEKKKSAPTDADQKIQKSAPSPTESNIGKGALKISNLFLGLYLTNPAFNNCLTAISSNLPFTTSLNFLICCQAIVTIVLSEGIVVNKPSTIIFFSKLECVRLISQSHADWSEILLEQ